MQKVTVRPDASLTARYPADLASRVTVRLKSGTSFTQEISDFPGAPARPFTWKEIDAKFDRMVAARIDDGLSRKIKAAVCSLENIQISELMKLLAFATTEEMAA
jgi:2-methylcitrate dehydratase